MKFNFCSVVFTVIFGSTLCYETPKKKYSSTSMEYYNEKKPDITINIKILIDESLSRNLTKKYGKVTETKIKIWSKKLMLDVGRLFKGLSVDRKIVFKLIGTEFMKKNKHVDSSENASKYLRSFCNNEMKRKRKQGVSYYSVLLTGRDLYYLDINGTKLYQSEGRGYINGVCHDKYSCTILEWRPRLMNFFLAHEVAHSIGVFHDGPPYNKCNPVGKMMGAKYFSNNLHYTWSECNKKDFQKFLRTKKARCFCPKYKRLK